MAITLPIFMVIYRFVTITRPFKAVDLFGIWSFTASPGGEIMSNLTNGGWLYIFLVLIIVPIQFISMVFPQKWAKTRNRNATAITQKGNAQYKKTKMTQYIFAGFMCFLVVVYATGVGVYWFLNSLFSLAQSYFLHKMILRSRKKHGSLEARLKKLGIE
jgi:YidC/Oxa1 family membrane protein insertase